MNDTGYWIMMLVFSGLMCPILAIAIGVWFSKSPPQTINYAFGYRTKRSMSSPEAWRYANQRFGKLILRAGLIGLPVSIAVMLFTRSRSTQTITVVSLVLITAQIFMFIAPIFPIERALKNMVFVSVDMPVQAKPQKKFVPVISLIITVVTLGGTMYAVVGSCKEPAIELTDSALVIKHFYGAKIDRSEVIGVEYQTAPLKITARTNGTAAGSIRTGNFTTMEQGAVRLYVFGSRLDGSEPYMVVFTKEKPIIIAFDKEERTREVYKRIDDWLTQR